MDNPGFIIDEQPKQNNTIRKDFNFDESTDNYAPKSTFPEPPNDDTSQGRRDPLVRTGRLFGGVIDDLRNRAPQYLSDLRDGVNITVFAVIIFNFFGSLSPAVTLGHIYKLKTNDEIGVSESMLIACVNGIIGSLLFCQPLLIVGPTGPLMTMDVAIYFVSTYLEIEFLVLRLWISIWMMVIGLVVAATDGSCAARFITRFLMEIYYTLMAVIYMKEPLTKIYNIFAGSQQPQVNYYYEVENFTDSYNETSFMEAGHALQDVVSAESKTALSSILLTLCTASFAYYFKKFFTSRICGRSIRRPIGSCGVPVAVTIMSFMTLFLFERAYTENLSMPSGLELSKPWYRGWFISPVGIDVPFTIHGLLASMVLSPLAYIIIFFETNICQTILANPEHHLKKGSGFHWDLYVCCMMNVISASMGAPFVCPAVGRTACHLHALKYVERKTVSGQRIKTEVVYEQRLSALIAAILIGLSSLGSTYLNWIPEAVLNGVRLFMGISAIPGIQFLERCILFFKPKKNFPELPFCIVKKKKIHLFTFLQLILVIIMISIKLSRVAVFYPVMIVASLLFRELFLPYIFTAEELIALDGKEIPRHDEVEDSDDEDSFDFELRDIKVYDLNRRRESNASKLNRSLSISLPSLVNQ